MEGLVGVVGKGVGKGDVFRVGGVGIASAGYKSAVFED